MIHSDAAKVAILHGAVPPDASPDERDSLVQVEAVSAALQRLGYAPEPVPFSLDLESVQHALQRLDPAFVFNLVESVAGSGQLIHLAPALLDYLGLRYTGSRTEALFITSNKILAKKQLTAWGIATPLWFSLSQTDDASGQLIPPYIIKSVWEHASIGLDGDSVVVEPQSPIPLLQQRHRRYGGEWFAEAYIEGREFNLSLLADGKDPQVLPPAEIRFVDYPHGKPKIVDYRAKWEPNSFEYRHTARSFDFSAEDSPLLRQLRDIALACWHGFELRGYARVDLRVDRNHQPWVLEVNANPCLAPDSGFIAAAQRTGLSFDQVIARLVA